MPKKPKYYLDKQGEFIIEHYNLAKPFASFFPGIAGKYGIPMWAFYVNRGQAIASFGTKDKDHCILEFYPANKSWQTASAQGWRTFIKLNSGKKNLFYEPFHNGSANLSYDISNRMRITCHGLKLEESNATLGLNIQVEYFTIPNDSFAALARIVTLKNTSRGVKGLQLLDGLPQVVPFGEHHFFLKEMSRTIEAWIQVDNLQNGAPFYRLAVDPSDRPEVVHIKEGHFYLGFNFERGAPRIIRPFIDPESVFGPATDFSLPYNFLNHPLSKPAKEAASCSKTPCAFLPLSFKLKPGEEKQFYALSGYMRNIELLNNSLGRITKPGYLTDKKEENKQLIDGLTNDIDTRSSSREFNLYARQTYLDNIMRGGYPLVFKSGAVFYLYSRKHGDLERDYNRFSIQPAYFSQGNGNYRDANQNRRSDIWFNPGVKEENIISFFNLLQADGFNPLVVKGSSFILKDKAGLENELAGSVEKKDLRLLLSFLEKSFTPGEVIIFLEDKRIKLDCSYDALLETIISCAQKNQEAEHGEGFWTDHWAYNLDLLDTYLGVYPEKLKELVFEKKCFTFFDNVEVVKSRQERYSIHAGKVMQLHALAADNAKKELIKKRPAHPHTVREEFGQGQIYHTTLLNKLLCLAVNKLASLDPFGAGIEMEANKPNWYDSLNGLPALLGSSLNETFELKRLLNFIKDALASSRIEKVSVTKEVLEFLLELNNLIQEYFSQNAKDKDYLFWDKSGAAKDNYRLKTKLGFSGEENESPSSQLIAILNSGLRKIDTGLSRRTNKNICCSYFINQVESCEKINEHFVKPLSFSQKELPLFLEGPVHALRLSAGAKEARAIYTAIRKSPLYDRKLKMYKVTAALKSMPEEIGRCRVFAPGWLENESVWLHMEYKLLLELLKKGLCEEFYQEFKNTLIPFQKAGRYGRSILENSSFLVSSAFPDRKLWGNGFVARLSGSTAEFLSIWLMMNTGNKPFFLNEHGELNLRLRPCLAGWLFRRDGSYSFNFLSSTRVVYHNPKRKNTFGKGNVKPVKAAFADKNGKPVEINSAVIPSPYAEEIRSRLIKRIDIYLA